MVRRQDIEIRRHQSWIDVQVMLAALAAVFAACAAGSRWVAEITGLAPDLGDGLALACLCAALASMTQLLAWSRVFKTASSLHERCD